MEERSAALEVENLKTYFFLDEGTVRAVDGVDFSIRRGQTLGVVGESGCGKSVTARSILRIVPKPGKIVEGEITLHRECGPGNGHALTEIVKLTDLDPMGSTMRSIRGCEIALVPQEPMASLSPVHTIGNQIVEAIMLHQKVDKAEARAKAIEMLDRVGFPQPKERVDCLPAPTFGRAAPARGDRHGAIVPPQPADRRRADDRAGRDDRSPNPETDARPSARVGHGDHVHHAQPGRGRADDRGRDRDVHGQGGRGGQCGYHFPQPHAPLHARPAAVHPAPGPKDARAATVGIHSWLGARPVFHPQGLSFSSPVQPADRRSMRPTRAAQRRRSSRGTRFDVYSMLRR